jgi:hypothetical protein
MNLDLNDLHIESLEIDEDHEELAEFAHGHGLTEIGSSCPAVPGSGQGSCRVQQK